MSGVRHVDVATNGTTLHVAVRGRADAPVLLLLHYFAGSARAWEAVVDALGDAYRCVALDLRGHGRSAVTPSGYTTADGADDVAGVIAALDIGDHALVGHSMGGKLALALAARQPSGLRALVLVAPSPPTPEPIEARARARALAAYGDRATAEQTADRIVARRLAPRARGRVVNDSLRTSSPAWRAWLEDGSREDTSASAGEVAVPTLVVVGGADPVLPPALLEREVVRRVRGARLAVVPDAGHLVPLEAPGELAELLAGELRAAFAATRRAATSA